MQDILLKGTAHFQTLSLVSFTDGQVKYILYLLYQVMSDSYWRVNCHKYYIPTKLMSMSYGVIKVELQRGALA